MRRFGVPYLPAILAAAAFIAFASVLTKELFAFRNATVSWARRDLRSQAELAAENLAEPLRTQDFRRIQTFADELGGKGLYLSVFTDRGGMIFRARAFKEPTIAESIADGEYVVQIAILSARVDEPFRRAMIVIALAMLVGAAGVMLFFTVIYRQRVRISELKRLEAFRRDFIADVSHEIKTPLTGILGAVDLLGDADEAGRARLLPMIRRESLRLNALAQGILSLARLERAGKGMDRTTVDLAEILREAGERYGIRVPAEGRSLVRCDEQLIVQAVSNLVENAKRHAGTADITLSLVYEGRCAGFAVEDHGVGIPPEHRERIFERFYRVDPSRGSETGGSGLGLAIVREIAKNHDGSVRLEAAEPSGCRFIFSFGSSCSPAC